MRTETAETSEEAALSPSTSAYPEWMLLFILAFGHFISVVDFMIIMPFGPQLQQTLRIDTAQFGWIVSSYTLAAGATGFLTATLMDRVSRKRAFLVFYAGFLVGTLLCGFATSFATLLAARIITGAFGGVIAGVSMAIIGDVFPEERRGRATGVLMTGFAVASATGVPLAVWLGNTYSWHIPFYVLAAVGLPILFLSMAFLPPLKEHLGGPAIHPLRFVAGLWTNPNQLYAFALTISLVFGGFAVIPFIPTFYETNVELGRDRFWIMYMIGGCLTLVGAPLAGMLADRFGKLRTFRAIAPLSAALLLAITMLPKGVTTLAIACFAGLLVVNAGRMTPALSLITSSVPREKRGGFMTANAAIQHFACGLGAAIAGQIIEKSPDGRIMHYPVAGVLAALVTLSGLWLAGKLRIVEPDDHTSLDESLVAAEAATDASPPVPVSG